MSEEAKEHPSYVGTSLMELVPTDDNILVKATAMNSTLGFINKEPDAAELFTYEVVGFGNVITDLKIHDIVSIMAHALNKVSISSNSESFEKMVKYINKLTNKDRESLPAKIKFTEYFMCKRYAIQGIITDDTSRNTINTREHHDDNVSSNTDTE